MNKGKVAKCHEINENLIAEVYELAAQKISDPLLKGIFLFIAHDSRKHAEILKDIAKEYGVTDLDPNDCAKFTGAGYGLMGLLVDAKTKIQKAETDKDILDVIQGIETVESTLVELDREILVDDLPDEEKRIMYKKLITYIEEDEVRHEKIIRSIFDMNNWRIRK